MAAWPAFADQDAPKAGAPENDGASRAAKPVVSRAKPLSDNATVNLVNLLVEQGVLSDDKAKKIIKQAEEEAYVARQAAKDATVKAVDATKAATAAAAAAAPPGSKHVAYVPEFIKQQMRDDIKKEVLAEAKRDNWASPGIFPEWATRVRWTGDIRAREQGNFYPGGGYNVPGGLTNFSAINAGSAYDVSNGNNIGAPAYNSSATRDYTQIRVRLGMEIDFLDKFTGGIRLGSGATNSPVSTNQTLGANGGNFSNYGIWLDRGFLHYSPTPDISASIGRFDNPFFAPTELVWYNDLAFDGFAINARRDLRPDFAPFIVGGAFPVYNSDLNLGATTNSTNIAASNAYSSTDRFLLGGQLGFVWRPAKDYRFTAAASYFDFTHIQGQLSSPCDLTKQSSCSTDGLRPGFSQKGNTYMPLRNIVPPVGYTSGSYSQPEYFGLASAFRPVVATARLDFSQFDPFHVILDGEFVINTGFNKARAASLAVNNFSGGPAGNGPYVGGNLGFETQLTLGNPILERFADWNVFGAYKYIQSDAMVDAFVDPNFGLGGTNLKGYILGGNFALTRNVWTTLRFYSATDVSGVPYAVDVLQLDLTARF